MKEYPKIETLFDRDPVIHKVIPGQWRLPEFEYLCNNEWLFTEKVDGTNVRVTWDGIEVNFFGRTDNAQMPPFLLARLGDLFTPEKMATQFGTDERTDVCLYGEGYGARIQKGGGNYKPDGVDFVLFDVKVGPWWLLWDNICGIGESLAVAVVPLLGTGTLEDAVDDVRNGRQSTWGDFPMEGLVVRPRVELFSRKGQRLLGKIKTRDF